MKRLITLAIILFGVGTHIANAQYIKVESIEELTSDIDARRFPRKDLNGDNCALLKISLPSVDGLEFKNRVVGNYKYMNGVYYVYVATGTKRLPFSHKDYRPGVIDFEAAGVTLESNNVYSVNLRAIGRDGDVIDLSADGTANCYIVSEPGRYMIKAVRGNNSALVEEVATVEVVWESFGTSEAPMTGDLVKDVSYRDGYITFTATELKGNALIAARKSSGWVMWSWHIWLTDSPEDVTYANGAGVMMDRNLGAVSSVPGDALANGLLYQWGRKDPFLGAASNRKNIQAKSTIVWPDAVSSRPQFGNMAYASAHPTTLITGNEDLDWFFPLNITDEPMWFGSKTMYDPCPLGYHVPVGGKDGVWCTARKRHGDYKNASMWKSDKRGMMLKEMAEEDGKECFYPASGYLDRDQGKLSGVGECGLYWSCTTNGRRSYALSIDSEGYVSPAFNGWRATAQSVRCIKD